MRGNAGMKESGKGRRAKHGHFKKQDESRDAQRRERDVKKPALVQKEVLRQRSFE